MMSEKKKNSSSDLIGSEQSTAREENVSNQISSHCENSAQTLSQITDAEIQKRAGHTKVIDEDKHIRVKINLNRLTSETLHNIFKKSKPATRDLIGAKKSDMPQIKEFVKGNVLTASKSAFNINRELFSLSDQIHDRLGGSKLTKSSITNQDIHATFSSEKNNSEMIETNKHVSEHCSKNVCIPFHYKKSKRNKGNLCWTDPTFVCNISDVIQPEVAEGIVDRSNKSIVISVVPSLNKTTPRRNRLTYKVQYRMSLKPKIYPVEFDKTNDVVRQLKRKPVSPISPSTCESDKCVPHTEIMSKKIKLSNFLIPLNTAVRDYEYTDECVAEKITFEEPSLHRHKSWIDNGMDKAAVNCETFVEKEMDVNGQKQRKRCSNKDMPCENKRKCIPEIEYHETKNKNEEFLHSMRTPPKDLLKTNDYDRIIMSRNKPIDTVQKCQDDASLSKRVNRDMTQIAKFSREMLTLTKYMPWDFALRTSQIVMPVTVELDKVGMNKSSEKLTNEIIIPEAIDEKEDNVLETRNVFETSTNDHSDCTMISVSETNVIENNVGEIVKEECNTVSNENDIEKNDEEIDDVANIFSDDEFVYPLPKDGRIWQITMDDSGAVIYETIRPGDTDGESANEESGSEDKRVENRLMYKENQNEESPILDIIKSSDSDAETEKYEEEIAESDVELNVIDEEKISISEVKIELWDEENSLVIEEKKPIFETPLYEEDNTVELDFKSLSNKEKHGELDSGTEIVDRRQTVDIDVQSHLYNEEQTIESDSKMNNINEIRDNPAEGTKINNNSEHHAQNCYHELVNSSPNRNQNELNCHRYAENQSTIKSTIPEVRRTSATTFEVRFNDFERTTPPNHQPEIILENVMKETNIINDVSSYAQKKEGKIIILEDKIVKLNVSGVSAEKQRKIDCQCKSMVLQNTTEQTEDQSVTKNDHQPLTTVPQQVQQPDTREFPQLVITQPQQRVIEEPRQLVPTKPQELVITEPQLPVTIASSGLLQIVVNNQNTSTYPISTNATSVNIQNATENQMPRVPLQIAGVSMPNSDTSGYTRNYNEIHQMLNSQIPSFSDVQATQRSETGKLRQLLLNGNYNGMGLQNNEEKRLQAPVQNHNLPIPYTAHNVQYQQNGPIAGGNYGETVKILSSNDKDIRVRQYNEKQVSHIPSQENNMVKQNLNQNPVAQHINQTSMLPNNYPRLIESGRSVVTVNQHTGNTEAQMPYQGQNIISQYSNQHFGIPQNRQMSNNQTVQSGQHLPREYASHKEINVPPMNLPRTGMVAEQNNQTQIVTNHQPIPEHTRYGLVHSTQSDPMLPMSNNGGTKGANGINMNQNPSIQPVNTPYAVVPYRNVNNLPSRTSPLQHNGAAINNNIHSYQSSVQNDQAHLPPPYQEHVQYNTQTLPNNNMEHASTSLQIVHQNCINTNLIYRHIMMEQHNQLKAMNMKIEELHVALQKKITNTPRRSRKKNDTNNEAIPPVEQNNSQQRVLENTDQQVRPTPLVLSENHDLTYRNHLARIDSQQVGPVPDIPSEEHRLAHRNNNARNNSQQMGPAPYVPSQENYLKYPNRPPGMDSQQVFPIPRVPPKYRNRPVWKESQEMSSTPLISPEESSLKYPNRSPGIDSQQVRPVTRTHFEDQYLKYANHPPAMDSHHVQSAPVSDLEEQYLKYIKHSRVQQDTQKRYPLTSSQPAGPAQNVIPAKNAHYPKPEAFGSQNVSVVQPNVPLGTPSQSTSHHQPQRLHPVSIYNRPVRNEAAAKLQNLNADKMHAQGKFADPSQSRNNDLFKIANLCNLHNNSTVQSNSPVNQLSNENGPINLSIHDKNKRYKPQQDNNVSDEATPDATGRKGNNRARNEYIELEALRKQLQKKQSAAPRNESRDSGYIGSPEKGEERHIICMRCGGPSFFKCRYCLKTFYCSTECQDLLRKNDIARCCRKEIIPKLN